MAIVQCKICWRKIDTEKEVFKEHTVSDGYGQSLEPTEYYCSDCYDFKRNRVKLPNLKKE